ncbi:unnamed protein product [Mycena citricolor]|uniref:GH16 domain-containing protein n=1 Tax=Mycena citricolor TaxID=2018698 RepID=A0AAD2H222_9AGAR|nr:unnamed protein product [Mycena citricolor]
MLVPALLTLSLSLVGPTRADTLYPLIEYAGTSFFDGFDFYGAWDNLTHGNVTYVTDTVARSSSLVSVDGSGRAVMRVDNTSTVADGGTRNSVRVTSRAVFPIGSVFVADMAHMPTGCSVWPSIWLNGILAPGDVWPDAGEIDLLEGINKMTTNQFSLHSPAGCSQNQSITQLGSPIASQSNCNTTKGCSVTGLPDSFGAPFNSAGGGVYALQFDVSGIYMWTWPRASVPQSISQATSGGPLTKDATWGSAVAAYVGGATCNIAKSFGAQQLVINIALCGDWAGEPGIYASSGCPAGTCYGANVVGNGSNYGDAYFAFNYIRVYSESPGASVAGSSSAGSGSASASRGSGPVKTQSAAVNAPTTGAPAPSGTSSAGELRAGIVTVGILLFVSVLLAL